FGDRACVQYTDRWFQCHGGRRLRSPRSRRIVAASSPRRSARARSTHHLPDLPARRRSHRPRPGAAGSRPGGGTGAAGRAAAGLYAPRGRHRPDGKRAGADGAGAGGHARPAVRAHRRRRRAAAEPARHPRARHPRDGDPLLHHHHAGDRRDLPARQAPAGGRAVNDNLALWVYLSSTPLLWLTVTLAAWLLADWVALRSRRNALVNPVLICIA